MFANGSFTPRSARPGTTRHSGRKILSPSEQLDAADRAGLSTCMEAYIRYRRTEHPNAFIPNPDHICGPSDCVVRLENVLPPRFEDLSCTHCGEPENLRSFTGKDGCIYVKCLECTSPSTRPSGSITTPQKQVGQAFALYDEENTLFLSWLADEAEAQPERDDDLDKAEDQDDSEAFFRPHRVRASSAASTLPAERKQSARKSSGTAKLSTPPVTPATSRVASTSTGSAVTSPTPAIASRPIAGLPKCCKAKGFDTVSVSLELISGKFKQIWFLGVKDQKLAWENLYPAITVYFASGCYAMEAFDSKIEKWVRFGVDTPVRVGDTQLTVLARVINVDPASVDPVEVSSETDNARTPTRVGQKRASPAPLKLSARPAKRATIRR
ncbi:hypothetical protein AURDEDRAFT_170279 [Auricularia subglabra TFB-10046 SS5]|nr:hypothetical protein AURDEDRAFT_170279 [Auricularia subglabra TFB-10046 SS5]